MLDSPDVCVRVCVRVCVCPRVSTWGISKGCWVVHALTGGNWARVLWRLSEGSHSMILWRARGDEAATEVRTHEMIRNSGARVATLKYSEIAVLEWC